MKQALLTVCLFVCLFATSVFARTSTTRATYERQFTACELIDLDTCYTAKTLYQIGWKDGGGVVNWTEVQTPDSGSFIVEPVYGYINGTNSDWHHNTSHVLWNTLPYQFGYSQREFEIDVVDPADTFYNGYFKQVASESTSCQSAAPSLAADEVFVTTVYDDGTTWVGGYVGNPSAFGFGNDSFSGVPQNSQYVEYGILQKDSTGLHRLWYNIASTTSGGSTVAVPFIQSCPFLGLSCSIDAQQTAYLGVSAYPDGSGGWNGEVIFQLSPDPNTGLGFNNRHYVPLPSAPNTSGHAGIVTIVDNGNGCSF